MCEVYISLGLPPDRFWQITPRLYDTEMKGALARRKADNAMVWWGAMLPHLKTPISLDQFIGEPKKIDVAAWSAAWDKVDRALTANRQR